MSDQPIQTRSRQVTIWRQLLLAALVAVLVFVPDDQLAIRVAAGLVMIAVFWLPPLARIVTNFRAGHRGDQIGATRRAEARAEMRASPRLRAGGSLPR